MKIIDMDEIDEIGKAEEQEILHKEVKENSDNEKKKIRKQRIRDKGFRPFRDLLSLILSVFLVVFLTFVIVRFVGQRTEVSGSSMENTLSNNDNLIVDKITYRFSEPTRFDIVVFPYEGATVRDAQDQTYYIKRIIGMPGETVQIIDGQIYINGEVLKESYGKEVIKNAKDASNPMKLGQDEYFVLGDNRNRSADSREIGLIKRDKIVGRAWLRIWPLESFGILRHQ